MAKPSGGSLAPPGPDKERAMLGKPSKRLKKQLEESGKRANATVIEIAEKGMAVTRGAEGVIGNTELALKTHLRVQPDDEPEFEVKKRFSYPQLAVPSAGQTVPVIYDPSDHDKIIVDHSPAAQQSAAFQAAGIDAGQIGQLMEQAQQLRAQAGQAQAGAPGMGQMPGTSPAPAQPDTVGQLERLAKLKESGALTDAEFEAEKAKILGQ
jgi:Short C-terminal domain